MQKVRDIESEVIDMTIENAEAKMLINFLRECLYLGWETALTLIHKSGFKVEVRTNYGGFITVVTFDPGFPAVDMSFNLFYDFIFDFENIETEEEVRELVFKYRRHADDMVEGN
jgi:hypothetical protein